MRRGSGRTDRPRPETLALARGRQRRPAGLGAEDGWSIEEELRGTRIMATRLLTLLRLRHPQLAREFLEAHDPNARSMVDRAFEASMVLLMRHGVRVEPCRKLLYSQDADPVRYSVEQRDGSWHIVDEEQLLAMAGVDA